MSGFAACRAAPELSEQVNVSAPAALAGNLSARGARVILLSSSAVLDCAAPHMAVQRPYSPRSIYGAHKAQAERAFLALGRRATVLRLSRVFGERDARIDQWTQALTSGARVEAVEGHTVSPLALHEVVSALSVLAEKGEGGVYQASGAEDWSYAQLATEIAARVGAPRHLVHARSARETGIPPDEVTAFTSLDCSRLTQFCGFQPPRAGDVLDYLLAQQRAMR
jgi:dTDP-4-dehydrorhamnose reductase